MWRKYRMFVERIFGVFTRHEGFQPYGIYYTRIEAREALMPGESVYPLDIVSNETFVPPGLPVLGHLVIVSDDENFGGLTDKELVEASFSTESNDFAEAEPYVFMNGDYRGIKKLLDESPNYKIFKIVLG
jgi:hypothetical protein